MHHSESEDSDYEHQGENLQNLNIVEPHEYLNYCLKDKKIKVMD